MRPSSQGIRRKSFGHKSKHHGTSGPGNEKAHTSVRYEVGWTVFPQGHHISCPTIIWNENTKIFQSALRTLLFHIATFT